MDKKSKPEVQIHVFSAELIHKVNKERSWTGGVITSETDFSDESDIDESRDLEILSKQELEITQSKHYDFKLNEAELKNFNL